SGEMGWTNVYYAVNDTAWFGTNTGRIYKTVDKGATWSVYTTGAANVSGISMNDALNGIMHAAVYDQTGQLTSWGMRKTNDGGETWASVTPGGPYYKSDMAAVPGIPGKIISTGISQDMAQCGSSYSFDYGATWTMLDDSIQYTMVEFFNDTTGWAGGFNLDENNEGIWKWLGIPVTNAPMFTSTPVTSVIVDSNYVYNITATDPAQNALTFDAPVLPSWLTLTPQTDSTAVLTGNPDSVDIGFHNVELSATNGNDTVHQNFVVEVITNVPFYVTAPTNSVIQAGQQYSFLVVADDYNGDTLTFGTNLLPGFLTITDHGNNTATVEGIPDTSCLGWNDVSITISDAMYTIEHTWKILVQPATGIAARLNADRMTVFPNPTKGEIIIILPEEVTGQDVEVSIINLAGEKLVCRKISGGAGLNRVSEDITSLSSGAYYLEIKTENGKYSEKIILQK
ncbi:MAG: T9SS type A sorting domain-containing protein, partial [Bacteroidota bacterium]